MKRCWYFEETGEVRKAKEKEPFIVKLPVSEKLLYIMQSLKGETSRKEIILKLTEYPSNPLESIREVWKRYKHMVLLMEKFKRFIGKNLDNPTEIAMIAVSDILEAIQKCMAVVEGKQ